MPLPRLTSSLVPVMKMGGEKSKTVRRSELAVVDPAFQIHRARIDEVEAIAWAHRHVLDAQRLVYMLADLLDDDVADVERVADWPALGIEKCERRGVLAMTDANHAGLVNLLQRPGERCDRRGSPRLGNCRTNGQQTYDQRQFESVRAQIHR